MNTTTLDDAARERCISNLAFLIEGAMTRHEAGCTHSRGQALGYMRGMRELVDGRSDGQISRMEEALGLAA